MTKYGALNLESSTRTPDVDALTVVLGTAAVIPFLLAFVAGMMLLDSFVLWKIWDWHAVPLGAIPLTLSRVVGLRIFFSVLTVGLQPDRPDGGIWKRIGLHLAADVIALGLAWIVK